jgi:class 3 adenylate cyclase
MLAEEADDVGARVAAVFLREATTPQALLALRDALREVDVRPLLPLVRAPTLVLSRRQIPHMDTVRFARDVVSGIPDARLTLLEGRSAAPWNDMEPVLSALDDFLGEGERAPARALAKEHVHTILFTDIEGSTTLTQRLGDAKAQDILRTHNTIVRDALKACGGSEIKHTGDGIMASFPSASRALQCAIAIQQAVAAQADTPFRARVGLNAGEPVVEDQDLFGTAVQLAARICAHAEPGQIVVPTVVRELAAGKGFLLADLGEVALRGFEDPVRLYEVRWREEG